MVVDTIVIGSGFAGSITAMALRSMGHRVAMVEQGRHPRFAIGESSTPLANLLLEEIADQYGLPRLRAFSKWGTWQRERPDVASGLKRGFSFFFHAPNEPFADNEEHRRQLLVAASPHDAVADTHWYRPDFDAALVADAQELGASYTDETRVTAIVEDDESITVEGERRGVPVRIRGSFLIDASGPRGCLHRLLKLGDLPLRWLPPTEGLYTHFENVLRWEDLASSDGAPPYPVDAAALHHVFPGGWIWVLRFNNGLTSAGAALTHPVAARIASGDAAASWQRLLGELPSVAAQFSDAREVFPFVRSPQIAFRSARVSGSRWALLPSAAGVIDPLLSTGFPLTLLGIVRVLNILGSTGPGAERTNALQRYEADTLADLDATEMLVAALYASMEDPPLFKALSLLYFTAASFSEASRRLGRGERARGFLLRDDPTFGAGLIACAATASMRPQAAHRTALLDSIARLIGPFDIAGLGDSTRRSWYPMLANDLIEAASKLDAGTPEIQALLARCGFAPSIHSSVASAIGPTMNNA